MPAAVMISVLSPPGGLPHSRDTTQHAWCHVLEVPVFIVEVCAYLVVPAPAGMMVYL